MCRIQSNIYLLFLVWLILLSGTKTKEDVKFRPHKLFGGGIFGQGQLPLQKNLIFYTRLKIATHLPDFEQTIALAFLKASCPQIPYWVHFILKVPNPIYILISIE